MTKDDVLAEARDLLVAGNGRVGPGEALREARAALVTRNPGVPEEEASEALMGAVGLLSDATGAAVVVGPKVGDVVGPAPADATRLSLAELHNAMMRAEGNAPTYKLEVDAKGGMTLVPDDPPIWPKLADVLAILDSAGAKREK